jgi:DNA replication protein
LTPDSGKENDRIFRGFPAGKLKTIPMPAMFFSEVLPLVDDLTEMKVFLYVFWLLSQPGRPLKAVSWDELLGDDGLLRSLRMQGEEGRFLLGRALMHAVERGVLLKARVQLDEVSTDWFFLNTESGRDLLNRVRSGEATLGGPPVLEESGRAEERSNIFVLYEQNIGLLQPLIVEELREAELLYSMDWIEEAFKIAVENNVRNWRYIRAILERWGTEGKHDEEFGRDNRGDGRSYLTGKYSDIIKH